MTVIFLCVSLLFDLLWTASLKQDLFAYIRVTCLNTIIIL